MALSLKMSDEIIADIIARHERQIAQLQSLIGSPDNDPETHFRTLMTLEAGLQDIRQGLFAAAYVAIGCAAAAAPSQGGAVKTSTAAVMARAQHYFRQG